MQGCPGCLLPVRHSQVWSCRRISQEGNFGNSLGTMFFPCDDNEIDGPQCLAGVLNGTDDYRMNICHEVRPPHSAKRLHWPAGSPLPLAAAHSHLQRLCTPCDVTEAPMLPFLQTTLVAACLLPLAEVERIWLRPSPNGIFRVLGSCSSVPRSARSVLRHPSRV